MAQRRMKCSVGVGWPPLRVRKARFLRRCHSVVRPSPPECTVSRLKRSRRTHRQTFDRLPLSRTRQLPARPLQPRGTAPSATVRLLGRRDTRRLMAQTTEAVRQPACQSRVNPRNAQLRIPRDHETRRSQMDTEPPPVESMPLASSYDCEGARAASAPRILQVDQSRRSKPGTEETHVQAPTYSR